ncbi:hypothetical protein HK101_000844 [Irineochytrium annulatum]|nr:hypothetical protein HK101_000844 [Irineochytrium annulatum]
MDEYCTLTKKIDLASPRMPKEAAGAPALPAIVRILHAVEQNDVADVTSGLLVLEDAIIEINKVFLRMYEKNDPHTFFNRVRVYLNGWDKSEAMPDGVFYEGVSPDEEGVPNGKVVYERDPKTGLERVKGTYGKYAGGSAGQSVLLHVLDAALGVVHRPFRATTPRASGGMDAEDRSQNRGQSILEQMRQYMPAAQRSFITAVLDSYSIRDFVASRVREAAAAAGCGDPVAIAEAEAMQRAFNRCVEGTREFRDKHIQMVAVYIVNPAAERRRKGGEVAHKAAAAGDGGGVAGGRMLPSLMATGTGGTNLIPFLKQSRDETISAVIQ